MIGEAEKHLAVDNNIKLVVIDEAHHAAPKNISYRPIFAHSGLGILGLTATPSRHDGEPLEFERESFSIGFPDLVKKGIVLKPEIRKIEGGTFNFSSVEDEASLEQLNTEARNKKIIAELLKHPDEYKKVIIYVGTVNHVKSLYDQVLKSPLRTQYDSISFITGEVNSRNQQRAQFVLQEKAYKRSILINVMVLSEGYDDPSVNTVVMATPSQSKLYYMQAMGRAIRLDTNDPLKKAYCVEIDDKLPNIRYRIDNRWLYSDVSDALEPAVIDRDYGTEGELKAVLDAAYDEYHVPAEYRQFPVFQIDERYTLLLFKIYRAPGNYAHFPLVITSENRLKVTNVFNFLSERMESFKRQGIVSEAAFRMLGSSGIVLVPGERERRLVYQAMSLAVPTTEDENQTKFITEGYPWITFAAFHYRQLEIPVEILSFIAEMVNRDAILEFIRCRDYEKPSYLLRLPLPLKSNIGRIVTESEYRRIDAIVQQLRSLRNLRGEQDHRLDTHTLLAEAVIPIELAFKDSFIFIARTDDPYSLILP
jgi:hypothetical protein